MSQSNKVALDKNSDLHVAVSIAVILVITVFTSDPEMKTSQGRLNQSLVSNNDLWSRAGLR